MDPLLEPDESDCCNSGCNPCILDFYEEQRKKYNEKKLKHEVTFFKNCLLTTSYSIFKVTNIESHSVDGIILTFEFVSFVKNSENYGNNLKVIYTPGQYLMIKATSTNEVFQRPYTPIPIRGLGKLQFAVLIKLYEVGHMCNYLKKLKIGSNTVWRGPYGNYFPNYNYRHILLIAQGVGIAPLYSIINDILKNDNCDSFVKLYFSCKKCSTIYLREQLYQLQSYWNFSYEVFLSDIENISPKYNEIIHNFKLSEENVKMYILDKCQNIQVLICGSENFMSCFKDIVKCDVQDENIVLF